jgi:histidinol-phosphate aminotransferase
MHFASQEIIEILNKLKPPYNINQATQELALTALDRLEDVNAMIKETVSERASLGKDLVELPFIQKIYPSDANFLLVKMKDATAVYNFLKEQGIVVRNRSNVMLCEDCLRITVGTPSENEQLLRALASYS